MSGVKLKGGADLGGSKVVNVADPSSGTDGANKQYVDNFVNGLSFKDEVRAATTTNGTLASAFANGQSVDGVALATGNRILIKNQTDQKENGIYVVNSSGAPTRAADADSPADLNQATVRVTDGTTNAGTQWTQGTKDPTVGTDNIVFASSGGGTAYTAGDGLTLTGTEFSADVDGTSIETSGGALQVNPDYSGLAKRYAADCAATTNPQTFTHNLGTKDLVAAVRLSATDEVVFASITFPTTSTAVVDYGGAPTSAEYRLILVG